MLKLKASIPRTSLYQFVACSQPRQIVAFVLHKYVMRPARLTSLPYPLTHYSKAPPPPPDRPHTPPSALT